MHIVARGRQRQQERVQILSRALLTLHGADTRERRSGLTHESVRDVAGHRRRWVSVRTNGTVVHVL